MCGVSYVAPRWVLLFFSFVFTINAALRILLFTHSTALLCNLQVILKRDVHIVEQTIKKKENYCSLFFINNYPNATRLNPVAVNSLSVSLKNCLTVFLLSRINSWFNNVLSL